MNLQEAHVLALKVLKQVMEEKLDENNVQLAQVSPGGSLLHHASAAKSQVSGGFLAGAGAWSTQADVQVTKEKGFQILGEQELKVMIEGIAA